MSYRGRVAKKNYHILIFMTFIYKISHIFIYTESIRRVYIRPIYIRIRFFSHFAIFSLKPIDIWDTRVDGLEINNTRAVHSTGALHSTHIRIWGKIYSNHWTVHSLHTHNSVIHFHIYFSFGITKNYLFFLIHSVFSHS